ETAPPPEGFRGSQEPGFEFPLGEHYPDGNVGTGLLRPSQKLRSESRRTLVVPIQHDQDYPCRSGSTRRQLNGALELAGLDQPVSGYPERRVNFQDQLWRDETGDPPDGDRDSFDLAVTLDDAGEVERHSDCDSLEEVQLLLSQPVGYAAIGGQLIEPQQLPGGVQAI